MIGKAQTSSAGALELIEAVQRATTTEALLGATAALASCADPLAVPCLVEVLSFNNPGAAVAAVDGLIRIGTQAVEPLLSNLDTPNYGARAWAVRALAGIGDVRGLDVLVEALRSDIGPSVRRAAARGLGSLRLAEEPPVNHHGTALERALTALEAGCEDGEWIVRYAVAVGLESLGVAVVQAENQRRRILAAMDRLSSDGEETTSVVRMRADLARGRLQAHWMQR